MIHFTVVFSCLSLGHIHVKEREKGNEIISIHFQGRRKANAVFSFTILPLWMQNLFASICFPLPAFFTCLPLGLCPSPYPQFELNRVNGMTRVAPWLASKNQSCILSLEVAYLIIGNKPVKCPSVQLVNGGQCLGSRINRLKRCQTEKSIHIILPSRCLYPPLGKRD